MASQSLYRKWRSQTFADLIGQEAVVRTLLNAVRDGRLAHAYLFCGPRGTGKTSAARLLAKAVNCANPKDGEPCNECVSCREIATGRSPDVIEIDAASNTGVDNIRDLRETVNLLGSGGHFKLYIVDECFGYGELVTLADGSKMPIGKLVESQWQGEVLSYNVETGKIEPKRIVRHMKKVPAVPTVRVTFDNNRSITCTINHKFYTPEGQVCAGHLRLGQFVYTNRERITKAQRAVVMGAALGDGHVSLTGSAMRGRLRLVHGVAQREYLEYKIRLLGDLVQSPSRYHDGAGTYSKVGTYSATTLSRPEIAQIHRELYGDNGRKRITQTYLDQLDELGLALWYLDDGSLTTQNSRYQRVSGGTSIYPATRSTFSTYGFTAEEARIICAWHQERWGIESGVTITARGPVVWLTLAGTRRLHQIIAPHVPPTMEYKLLPAYRGQFQPREDDGISSGLAVSVVKSIEPVPMPEFVYNIEVEDNHNYFVRDMLVANCHMLTTSAFNALLKTLEEPPPHIIFVLATTEAHKVLPTVVSRCQRFDFRRIGMRDIVARLKHVAAGEGLELEPAAAELIARAAQGGMRDALSLLDQAMAYCGAQIDLERTRAMLGLADSGAIRRLVIAVAEGQAAEGLHLINELVTTGADLRQLNAQLGEEWRALVLARAGADVAALMDRTDEDAKEIAALAAHFSLEELAACARVFARNETPARGLPVPQLGLELSFLECIGIRERKGLPVGAQPVLQSPAPQQRQAQPRPAPPAAVPTPTPTASRQPPAPPVAASAPTIQPAPVEELDLDAIERGTAAPAPDIWTRDDTRDTGAIPEHTRAAATPAVPAPDVWPSATEAETPDTPEAANAYDGGDGLTALLGEAQGHWELIKQVCKQKSRSVAALLHSARPVEIEPGDLPVLVVQADFKFHLDKLREPNSKTAVEWALEQVLQQPVRMKLTAGSSGNGSSNGSGGAGPGSRPGPSGGNGDGNGRGPGGPTRGTSPVRPPAALNGAASTGRNGSSDGSAHPAAPANGNGPGGGNVTPAASNVRHLPAERMIAPTAVREPAADYGGERMSDDVSYAASNITPLRPPAARMRAPARSLEDEVRGDAVIQALMRTHGIELADVRPLTDADGGE